MSFKLNRRKVLKLIGAGLTIGIMSPVQFEIETHVDGEKIAGMGSNNKLYTGTFSSARGKFVWSCMGEL